MKVESLLFPFRSPSKKHTLFVNSPMGGLPVTALPGIGPVWGGQLKQNGYVLSTQIFGQYLVMQQDYAGFTGWLQNLCGIGPKCSWRVYNALEEKSHHHLLIPRY